MYVTYINTVNIRGYNIAQSTFYTVFDFDCIGRVETELEKKKKLKNYTLLLKRGGVFYVQTFANKNRKIVVGHNRACCTVMYTSDIYVVYVSL